MLDLILRRCALPTGGELVDIAVKDGSIAEVRPALEAQARDEIAVDVRLVTPSFVDSHSTWTQPSATVCRW